MTWITTNEHFFSHSAVECANKEAEAMRILSRLSISEVEVVPVEPAEDVTTHVASELSETPPII